MADLGLGEKIIDTGLRLYDKFADRKTMPTNRRIFLESVLDKSKQPITESAFSPEELDTLGQVIYGKYRAIDPQLSKYESLLADKMTKHAEAVAAKNKDRILYPEYAKQYSQELAAIRAYRQGKLTPEFLSLAADRFNVKPNVVYEDYGIDPEKARTALSGSNPREALHTTLGRFVYTVDPQTGGLVITDKYDFNPTNMSNQPVSEGTLVYGSEGGGAGLYGAIREYAGNVLPPGSGRDVRIQLNQLAPPVKNSLTR